MSTEPSPQRPNNSPPDAAQAGQHSLADIFDLLQTPQLPASPPLSGPEIVNMLLELAREERLAVDRERFLRFETAVRQELSPPLQALLESDGLKYFCVVPFQPQISGDGQVQLTPHPGLSEDLPTMAVGVLSVQYSRLDEPLRGRILGDVADAFQSLCEKHNFTQGVLEIVAFSEDFAQLDRTRLEALNKNPSRFAVIETTEVPLI